MNDENLQKVNKPGLFRDKFYTDWVVLLGVAAAAAGAYGATRNYGNIQEMNSADWTALTIDAGIASVINALIFGYIPAALRRKFTKKNLSQTELAENMEPWKFPLLVLMASAIVVFAGLNANDEFAPVGVSGSRCVPKGVDELCVEAKYLGEKRISLMTDWNYSSVQMISGLRVAKISWLSRVDCNSELGYIEYLKAFDPYGNKVELPISVKDQMIDGLESNQLQPSVSQMCSKM
jgi:hypothetical protein